jgi:hypothetical protein
VSFIAEPPEDVPRTLARVLIGLLVLDAVLAWLAVQASFVFLELVWRSVAGRENWGPLIEAHARQFTWLRIVEAVAWLATATIFVWWLRRIRSCLGRRHTAALPAGARTPWRVLTETWHATITDASGARMPPILAWWWTLLCGVVATEAWALVRVLIAGTPLELGRGLMLVLVASALEIAGAVLTVFVVIALQDGVTPPPAGSVPH